MTAAPAPLVLLDLDGTLTDSAPGIMASARAAFTTLGLPVPSAESLRSFVGPPLPVSLRAHGIPESLVPDAVRVYRGQFEAGGMWDSQVFPGIPEQLTALRKAGCTLAVATSKPEVYARPICERYGISALVDGVFGAPLDHIPSTKATVIAHALAELGPRNPGPELSIMVGDRHHDVDGAAQHHIRCLGVAWGYAEPGELSDAIALIPTISDLASQVLAALGVDQSLEQPAR